jgi:hypothetical protein
VLVRMERLRELATNCGRPEADFLRDGIHESRATSRGGSLPGAVLLSRTGCRSGGARCREEEGSPGS